MKRITLYMMAAMLLSISCNQESDTPVSDANPDAVAFSANIREITRATDIAFEDGDQISLFASDKGSIYSDNYAQNIKYTYSEGLFTTQDELVYPDRNTTLSFYAVYPFGSYTTPEFTFSVNKDQSSHTSYTESDLMTASAAAMDQDVVDLTFNHNLTKIVINFASDNLPAGKQSITFNDVYYKAEANLASNTFKATGSRADVVSSPNGTNSFKVILPPQTITAGTELLDITIGSENYVWTVERDLILASGVEYVYTLQFSSNSVSFTSNINPWNEPSDIQSVIPQQYIDILDDYIPIYEGNTPPIIEGVWLMDPSELYYDSEGYYDYSFAPAYWWFYDQSGVDISMMMTQDLGDLTTGEGAFISGSGNNFTIYFNDYTSRSNGAWMVSASIISGTKSSSYIKNMRYAFIVLDTYDPEEEMMTPGMWRVIEDGDYSSGTAYWPLDTRTVTVEGDFLKTKK